MALDAGEAQRSRLVGELRRVVRVGQEPEGGALPDAPGLRRRHVHRRVRAGQPLLVGGHVVASLLGRDRGLEHLPHLGEELVRAALVEPEELAAAQEEDAAQHHLGDPLRVLLGVGQRERRSPAAAEHLPPVDAQVRSYALDVGDQVPRRVLSDLRVGPALAAAALVEQDDAVALGIEEAPVARVGAVARPAVQKDHRLAARVAAHLPVDAVEVGHLEEAGVVRLRDRIQPADGIFVRHRDSLARREHTRCARERGPEDERPSGLCDRSGALPAGLTQVILYDNHTARWPGSSGSSGSEGTSPTATVSRGRNSTTRGMIPIEKTWRKSSIGSVAHTRSASDPFAAER